MAFLEKANEDPSKGTAAAQGQGRGQGGTGGAAAPFRARQEGVEVPAVLAEACASGQAVYMSDADEPFEPVAIAWDERGKGLPDEGT